nr:MAG TPA: hypothetical protein [Caudoviricetes sp.]
MLFCKLFYCHIITSLSITHQDILSPTHKHNI